MVKKGVILAKMKRKFYTSEQLRQIDQQARQIYGIPTLLLMENAGRFVCESIMYYLRKRSNRKVILLCGTGNNGGDGFVCARHLCKNDVDVFVYIVGRRSKIKGPARINLRILEKLGISAQEAFKIELDELAQRLKIAGVIVDGIFGVGLDRDIQEPYWSVIETVNMSGRPVVAIDIPSGLDADTGKVRGIAVRANWTVTFEVPKKGMVVKEGPSCCGEIVLVDIGIPAALFK